MQTFRKRRLELVVEQLPRIWTEEADRANRAAERAEKAGRRSRKKRDDEDPAPDDDQLSFPHGSGSGESGLPAVQAPLAADADQAAYLSALRIAHALSDHRARH